MSKVPGACAEAEEDILEKGKKKGKRTPTCNSEIGRWKAFKTLKLMVLMVGERTLEV